MTRLLPRLGLGAVVLAIGFMAKGLVPHFEDPDFYWHIATGEHLLASWPLARSDVFTYTHAGNAWVLSEWLAQIVLFLTHDAAGLPGVAALVAALCAFCGWLIYLACRPHVANPVHAIVIATACSLFFVTAAPRPHLFTFVFFAATLNVLLAFKYGRRDRLLALLPLIMLLWANTHGGFFIGLVLIAVFVASEALMRGAGAAGAVAAARLRRLVAWSVTAALATLVNPEFLRLWWYPLEVILLSRDVQTINEWQSPSFHVPLTQGFLALVLLFFAAQAWTRRRPDLTETVIPLVFIAGAFVSVRNLPLAAMALAPFLAMSAAHLRAPTRGRAGTALGPREVQAVNWILLLVAVLGLALAYPAQWKKQAAAVATHLPVGAADFIVANGIGGSMFNAYHYGGYLIHRLYPAQRVFIYGRTDIYPQRFLRVHDAIYQGRPDWQRLLDGYDVDYVICESNAALRQLLVAEGTFRLVYDDGFHSVLLKNAEKHEALIARFGREPAGAPK